LGHFADNLYDLGSTYIPDFAASLDIFADSSFPHEVAQKLKFGLAVHLGGVDGMKAWDSEKNIWQTDKDRGKEGDTEVMSWRSEMTRNQGWKWDLLTDE
jgi:hypothetical protein